VNDDDIEDTATVAFTEPPPQPTALAFLVQPSDASAGATITPPVAVHAVDGSGNTDTSFGGEITVAIGTNPGGGTLDGTTTRTAVAGVATFDDLSIAQAGSGYTLTASASGLTSATSTAFDIAPGPASGETSTITADPTAIPADGASTSAITVDLKDGFGNERTSGGDIVTLATTAGSLGPVTDNGDGSYGAVLTAPTTAGTATITGTVNGAAIADTASVQFAQQSAAQAVALAFLVQPSDAPAGATIVPPVVVRALDGSGNTDASFGGQITVAIGTNPGGGTLDGTTTRTAVAGVATFDDLSIARTGAGYTLVASGGGLTNATSAAFDITPGPASGGNSTITADPVSIPADGASTSAITVELKDAFDNDLVAGGDTVTLATTAGSLGPVTDRGNGTYTATLTASSAAGTATITGRVNGQTISGTATVTFARGSADLAITVAANDPTPVEGGTVVYTVTVTNNGPDVATGVEVTDELADLASRVTFVSATATRGTYDSGAGLWSLGTLPSGESAILIVTVRVNRDAGGP
ncbi:MAG TPA: invasin domain 3-containing protein, partial [Gemmatimonadota bacterium]|nr:invasin domain 3-containing protein [Gemmatimonadota bacterium]